MIGIFLDSETNGLNPQKHKIVELAIRLINLKTGVELTSFETLISLSPQEWEESDPSSLQVNGFTWEETTRGLSRQEVSSQLVELFKTFDIKRGSAVFICQNPSFDRAFFGQLVDPDTQESLLWPYHWLDLASMYWAEAIRQGNKDPKAYPWNARLSKDAIAEKYHLPPENKPHRAMNGTLHLIACYKAVVGFPQ